MKHKAQEALDDLIEISCPRGVSCKECNIEHKCNSLAKDCIDDVQKLIDCQLTREFIDMTINIWESEIMNCTGYTNDEEQCVAEGLKLLKQQKEMWEVE